MTTTATTTPAAPQAVHLPSQIEHLATAALVPYARNSRTHSPEQVAAVARSIQQFGFTNPVLIDAQNTIIAGHGRIMAAQQLGLATVPCIRLAHLTDAQRRAYVIADNKLAELSGWDMATLAREVEDLMHGDGFAIDLLGFGADELQAMLAMPGTTAVQPVELPALKSGDRQPIQQITFTLHDTQAEVVAQALALAKAHGPFGETGNENGNGNAIARVCAAYVATGGRK